MARVAPSGDGPAPGDGLMGGAVARLAVAVLLLAAACRAAEAPTTATAVPSPGVAAQLQAPASGPSRAAPLASPGGSAPAAPTGVSAGAAPAPTAIAPPRKLI